MTPRNERRLWALLPLALGFLAPIIAVACIAPTPRVFITGRGLFIVLFLVSTSLVPFAALSAACAWAGHHLLNWQWITGNLRRKSLRPS